MPELIDKMIKDGDGKAELKTVGGCTLTVKQKDGKLWLIDAKGDKASITIANVEAVERRHPRHRHRAVAGLNVHRHRRAGAKVLAVPR